MTLLGVVLVAVSCCLSPVWTSSCSGAFDFIFIIDSSVSLRDHYKESVVPFVENVANHFINPDFRLSFITFDRDVRLHLPLTPTEDSEAVRNGIDSMRNVEHGLGTNLPLALDEALLQISNESEAVKVILVVTDGMWTGNLYRQVKALRELGVLRFIVAVGQVYTNEFLTLVDSENHTFTGNDFLHLQEIIDMVVDRTCVEVTSIDPGLLCQERNATDLVLGGRGFTISLDRGKARCRFKTETGTVTAVTHPVGGITKNSMTCEDPGVNKTGTYILQVTLDGSSYVTSSVGLVIDDCKPGGGGGGGGGGSGGGGGGGGEREGGGGSGVDVGLAVGILFAIIGLILLILLCCLWIFFPLITCRIVGGLPPEPKEEEPEPVQPKPGRKWEVVDASYYGRGGAGGIRPVTVRWGQGGATEEGNKLTKAKDAEVLEVVVEPGVPAPPVTRPPPPGCWEKFKKKVKRMYAVASSYRPVWGPTKRVLWFPGTKPEKAQSTPNHFYEPPPTARKSKPTPAPLRAGSSSAFLLPENGSVSSPVSSPPPSAPTRPRPPPPRPTRAPPPPRPPSINRPSRPAPPSPGNS